MTRREIAVGIVLLAVLAAGAWWARSPSAPADRRAPGMAAADDEALPDVTLADGTADVGGVRITLSVTPNPPVALARFLVRLRAEANGSLVAIENGRVSFGMAMPMGDHRHTLVPGEEGWLEAAVVLPT